MKIGIDVQTTLGQKTGFGFYVKNLVSHMQKIGSKDNFYFIKPDTIKDFSAPQRFVWDQLKVPNIAQKNKVDILHQPCFSAPVFYKGKVVVTIHDLIAIKYGKDIPFFSRMYFGRWMPLTYHRADAIIAISEHTKKDIQKYLRVPDEKIFVIPSAASDEYKVINDKDRINKVKNKYKTGDKYLLHIGTLNPRKNLLFLIDVFYEVSKRLPDYKLVIVGKEGWYYDKLYQKVEKYGLQGKVVFTGYIDEADKVYLYNGSSLFVFPSLYEGFGLPPLEAMKCAIPVISSNTSSLPEVVSDAGILLSPTDKKGWIDSITRVLIDKKLYENLSKKSLEQANKFSWERCAKQTLEVYKKVYENSN